MGSVTKQATFRLSPEASQILENVPRGSRGHFISRLILAHYKEHPDFFFIPEDSKPEEPLLPRNQLLCPTVYLIKRTLNEDF